MVLFSCSLQAQSKQDFSDCVSFSYPETKRSEIDLFVTVAGNTFYCLNDGTQLHVINIETNTKKQYSLEPIQAHRYGFLSLTFMDETTVACIDKDEKSVIIFDLEHQEVLETISFSSLLKPLEYLYVSPVQRIEVIGSRLIIPTIFGAVSYNDQEVRKRVLEHPPFVIYDFEQKKISSPRKINYWPSKYQEPNYYDDYVPKFTSNGHNELYLSFKYSDSVGVYNLDNKSFTKVYIALPSEIAQQGLAPTATRKDERKFRITEARIYNYIYNANAKQHIILFKPSVPYIINDRIVRYEEIDWWLLVYNDEFELIHKEFMDMDSTEWHILENKGTSIMLSGGIERPNQNTIKQQLKCLNLL
jgi:hypothetical protein